MREELKADYGSTFLKNVSDLETAAKTVISQGELLSPGDEYDAIRQYLEQSHTITNTSFPASVRTKLTRLSMRNNK